MGRPEHGNALTGPIKSPQRRLSEVEQKWPQGGRRPVPRQTRRFVRADANDTVTDRVPLGRDGAPQPPAEACATPTRVREVHEVPGTLLGRTMEKKSRPTKRAGLANRKSRAKKLVAAPPATRPPGRLGCREPYASGMQPKAVSTSRPAPFWCYCANLTASAVVVLAALCLGI